MGREGVIDIGHAPRRRIVRHDLGGADAPDAPAIDLNEADPAVIDQVAGHRGIVGPFSSGRTHLAAFAAERCIGLQGSRMKRLLDPRCARARKSGKARRRGFDVFVPNLARVDQEGRVRSQALAGGRELILIRPERAPAEGSPTEFDGPEARSTIARQCCRVC